MSIRIGSSGSLLGAIRSLRLAENRIAQSSARLASGLRINRAADDAAGLAISEGFRAEIASLGRAQLNTQDGISLTQTAQGGLSEVSNLLSEARALAVQSASGTVSSEARAQLDIQFQSILSEIDSIASTTRFGDLTPLDDDSLQIDLAVGSAADDTLTVSGVDATAAGIGVDTLDIATASSAGAGLSALDSAISNVSTLAASFGTSENRLASRSRLLGIQIEANTAADSRIRDADFAVETAVLARNQILQESAIAMIGQANTNRSIVLRLLE